MWSIRVKLMTYIESSHEVTSKQYRCYIHLRGNQRSITSRYLAIISTTYFICLPISFCAIATNSICSTLNHSIHDVSFSPWWSWKLFYSSIMMRLIRHDDQCIFVFFLNILFGIISYLSVILADFSISCSKAFWDNLGKSLYFGIIGTINLCIMYFLPSRIFHVTITSIFFLAGYCYYSLYC